MRLKVHHNTTYRYARPVAFNPHRLMLRPRGGREMEVLSHEVRCSPTATVAWSQDVFGNLVAIAEFGARASELTVTSELAIETSAEAWPVFPIAPRVQSYPFEYAADEATDLGALRSLAGGAPDVALWAQRFVLSRPTDTLALLKDLNSGILANTTYRRREEEGVQTAAETLAIGSGSCRDLAGLFIEAARTLGFGARAVSGYLVDPQSLGASENTTHAWAEVYLPGAGWIAFDPTNATVGNGSLIPVSVGRCNAQTSPVSGSYVGAPNDMIALEVDVQILAI